MLCLYLLAPLLATTLCGAPAEESVNERGTLSELYMVDKEGVQLSGPRVHEGPDSLTGIARRVSYCESGLRNAENPNSTASGYFQFLDRTWNWVTGLGGSASDSPLSVQLEAFHRLWDEGKGASHWGPSRHCWQLEEPWEHYDR